MDDFNHPMPGDKIRGMTCIASVIYREADDEVPYDLHTVVLLADRAPFYHVLVIGQPGGPRSEWVVDGTECTHDNIVYAITGTGNIVAQSHFGDGWDDTAGYVDLGGDV
jgi:hypothetical protein